MKILQINCVYAKGSTGKITADLHQGLLNSGIDSVVLYGRGKKSTDPKVIKTCGELYSHINKFRRMLTGLMYGGCFFSTNRLIKEIKRQNPDVVHLQCINGDFVNIYRLISWLKKSGIKTILTLHAEFMYTANCGYALDCEKWKKGCGKCPLIKKNTILKVDNTKLSFKKMRNSFEGFSNLFIISCSNWIRKRAMLSPILKGSQIKTIYNGIKTDLFHSSSATQIRLIKEKYGIEDGKKIVLCVTPDFYNPIKGGVYYEKLCDVIHNEFLCLLVGSNISGNKNIKSIPYIYDQEDLSILYSMTSVFVITSKLDNYPTVCLEANCCGVPVVGFDTGGVSETIFPGLGQVVEFGNVKALATAVEFWASQNIDRELIQKARERNDVNRMLREYLNVYKGENNE